MDNARLDAIEAKAEAALSLAGLALMLLEPDSRFTIAARLQALKAERLDAGSTRADQHRIEFELKALESVLD